MKIATAACHILLSAFAIPALLNPAWGRSPFIPYAQRTRFLATPPGAADSGLLGYANPALLNYVQGFENILAWSDPPAGTLPVNRRAFFSALPHLGFGAIRQKIDGRDLGEYRLSLGGGDRRFGLGIGYGWSIGYPERNDHLVFGALLRPSRHLSTGITFTTELSGSGREGTIDLALRPFASPRFTLFADASRASRRIGDRTSWSAGAELEPLRGLRLVGRISDDRVAGLGLHFDLGRLSVRTRTHLDEDRDRTYTTYLLHLGPAGPTILDPLFGAKKRYLELELNGPLRHRRFLLFDDSRTLVELTGLIRRAGRDPQIAGLALNFSGLVLDPEIAWELRDLLADFRRTGKKVVIYIDRADIRLYHLASIADHLVLDPAGLVALQGFVAGRTFFKNALDRMGIGFDEWRFFEYKSALEDLSREELSPPARRQLQEMLDDFYDLARGEICASRSLSPGAFDRLVDAETLFLPEAALEQNLVDRLDRWSNIGEIVAELEGKPHPLAAADAYSVPRDRTWGAPPRIALVYALGLCAMDQGIRARRLVEELATVRDDDRIAAVVLRVDSPGGDVLPSDLVAEGVRQCREQKPVIVSQGYVAASGGYWISMYADAIVAAPNTITGSIGVIGGWAYDRGLKQRLGLTTDHVQAGARADLGFGAILPLLGLQLPDRNLIPEERQQAENAIRTLYGRFVTGAAEGRKRSPEQIEAVAQGHVWTGRHALGNGLIDRLGGLWTAVQLAKEKAGIPADRPVQLREYPRPPLFDPGAFRLGLPLVDRRAEASLHYLQFRLGHNGQPLLLLPEEYFQPLPLEP